MGAFAYSVISNINNNFKKGIIVAIIFAIIPILFLGISGTINDAFAQSQRVRDDTDFASIPFKDSQNELNVSPSLTQQIQEKTTGALSQLQKEYVPGQLIVTFKKESDISNIREVPTFNDRVAKAIPEHEKMVKWKSPENNIVIIKTDSGEEEKFRQMLIKNPNIKAVERDFLVYPRGHVTSSDPLVGFQAWHYNAINLVGAWHHTTGSPLIIVAAIDGGVDFANTDLGASFWLNDDSCGGGGDDDVNGFVDDCIGWDFADNDNFPQDVDGHGTFVSGLMTSGLNNGIGGTGIAPQALLMPLKVFPNSGGGAAMSDILSAMTYAVNNGASVMNLSLGGYGPCLAATQNVLDFAYANNVVVVQALGNDAFLNVQDDIASCNHVVAIGSTDNFNLGTSYGNWDVDMDMSAPGGDLESIGGHTGDLLVASNGLGNTFVGNLGNSFAAPHVSACLALMFSVNPNLTFDQAQGILESTALDLTVSGFIPNLAGPGKDVVFGHGLLQCEQAVMYSFDSDGDGVLDTDDICPGGDDNVDTDGDGIPDDCDPDVVIPMGSSVPGCEETNECYLPFSLAVDLHSEVTWLNNDNAAHTVTSGDTTVPNSVGLLFDSGLFLQGSTFSHTFDIVGTFPYFCVVHPWMQGEIIVNDPISGATPFADVVVSYDNLYGGAALPPPYPPFLDPTQALGAPNFVGLDNLLSVTLGSGGLVEVGFVDNLLTNSGDGSFDLLVYEIGRDVERTYVSIRPTAATAALLGPAYDTGVPGFPSTIGDGFYEVGVSNGSTGNIDIDSFFPATGAGTYTFDAVQLIDDPLQTPTPGLATLGADIDAVGTLSSTIP